MPLAPSARREDFRQVTSFLLVGGIATAAHYAVLIAMVEAAHIAPLPATLAGYLTGGVISYRLNRSRTFRSTRSHAEAGWRFVAVAGGGFLMTLALMEAFVVRLGLPYLPAQMATTGLLLIWSFSANRLWTFSSGERTAPADPGGG
ncbi:GtrA family protein [Faunimonas pinastri]|uniref:GtrA family protein n=1 Tax=Faunimonas pinastri TaxID=1855383 RepID=UPI001EEC7D00|nr:GtrA family protein [Faunimonas pinastri]